MVILSEKFLFKIININFVNIKLFHATNYLFIYEKNVNRNFQQTK